MLINITSKKCVPNGCGNIYYTIIKKINEDFYLAFSNDNYWLDDFFCGYGIYVVISTETICEIPFFYKKIKI